MTSDEQGDASLSDDDPFDDRATSELKSHIAELELALAVTSLVDARTGMASRNALLDSIERELHRLDRYGASFGLLVCRLSPADDTAHLSAVIKSTLRSLDEVATWELHVGVLLEGLAPTEAAAVWSRLSGRVPVIEGRFVFPTGSATAGDLLAAGESGESPVLAIVDLRDV